jgi:glycosyltransferase involved in cell wall biosynthesis
MPEAMRKIWLLSKEAAGDQRMSPGARISWMRESAIPAECEVEVVCCLPGDPAMDHFLSDWKPGQPVVLDPYIPGKALVRLLASRIPFDADFYCLSIPETAEQFPERPRRWQQRERIRRALKYAWIAKTARRLYFSTPQQVLSFAGILATGPDRDAPAFVGKLPSRCIDLPLCARRVAPGDLDAAPTPYPPFLEGRPIALWGGGIWPWFDMETLLRSFASLPDRDRGPVLFFLSGSNHRPDPGSDEPITRVRMRAAELGVLDRNVFFNATSVSPDRLAPWLRHATMGIMANPDSWEARVSWRTRYLDLLTYGVPLVVAGSDPLAEKMTASGAALLGPAGDASALAANILRLAGDPSLRMKMQESVREVAAELDEGSFGSRWIDSLREDRWIGRPKAPPGWIQLLRFRLGRG